MRIARFKHFVTYGLRPQVLREWKVDPIETGTFYHAALNGFARLVRREAAYPNLPDEAVSRLADEAVEPLVEEGARRPHGRRRPQPGPL